MKRQTLFLAPDAAEGGLSTIIADDNELNSAVLERLGVDMEGEGEPVSGKVGEPESEPPAPTHPLTDSPTHEETPAEEPVAEEAPPEEEPAAAEAPAFTAEQQAWLDAQAATRQTELDAARAEAEQARTRLTQAETDLARARETPVAIAPIHPLLLAEKPEEVDAAEAQLAQFERWALKHWDGVDPSEDGKQPGYTAQQVRERYGALKEIRERMVPAAREALARRQQEEAAARRVYPELFDPARPEHNVLRNLLAIAPGLKAVIPNLHLVIGDALRGEKARQAAERARTAKPAAAAPKVPARPRPAPAKPAPRAAAESGAEINAEKFMELGGDRAALVALLK
jgi:hypothetical protein